MSFRLSAIKKYSKFLGYCTLPWIVVAFFLSFISFFAWGWEVPDKGWPAFFLYELQCITPWIIFTPVIVWLFRRFDFKKPKRFKSFLVHFFAILFCFSIHCIVQTLAVFSFFNIDFDLAYFWVDFVGFLNMRIVFYAGIALSVKVFSFYKRDREMALREPRLRSELNKTKFQGLKNQMQPQFLLHTLDAVAHNIDNQPEVAEEIVVDLSDLLRVMLDLSNPEKVKILDNLRHLSLYLEVLNKKANRQIGLTTDVSPECYDARIPTVIYLIPFFEAVHSHNLQRSGGFKKIVYKAHKRFNGLRHCIILAGINIDSGKLSEIRHKVRFQRMVDHLKQSYSSRIQLNCSAKKNQVEIVFELPLKEAPVLNEPLKMQENAYK